MIWISDVSHIASPAGARLRIAWCRSSDIMTRRWAINSHGFATLFTALRADPLYCTISPSQTRRGEPKRKNHPTGWFFLFEFRGQKTTHTFPMKHRCAIWSTRYARMMRLLRKHEAKRTLTYPWAEGSLHRAKPYFIFHAPKVRFIEKSTCFGVPAIEQTWCKNRIGVVFWKTQRQIILKHNFSKSGFWCFFVGRR